MSLLEQDVARAKASRAVRSERKRRKRDQTVNGPIPLDLLQKVSQLPNRPVSLFLAIWHKAKLDRAFGEPVSLPQHYLAEWGLKHRSTFRDHRDSLLDAGVISEVRGETGQKTRFVIRDPFDAPLTQQTLGFEGENE